MKATILAVLTCLAISVPLHASESESKIAVSQEMLSDQLAVFVEQEVQRRKVAALLAPVKSLSDLNVYLASTPKRSSSLNKLSPSAKQRFLNSLTFNENGLTGYSYADLRNELSATEIYEVLSLFGQQHTTSLIKNVRMRSESDRAVMSLFNNSPMLRMPDHSDYRCESRGTCSASLEKICTSNC